MSEATDLTVIEIKPEQAPALFSPNGLDAFLEQIKQAVNEVPDLSTDKGRKRIASLAAQVSRSKTAIEKPGREYLKRLKAAVKPAEQEIKRFVDECDALRDATRQPLTEWEAEQERIKAEEEMNAKYEEALAMNAEFDRQRLAKIEADHEMALLMNEKFDRDAVEAKAEKERKRIAYEEELKRLAENAARLAMEQEAQREREESAHREAVLKAQAGQAERDRIEAEQRAEREKKEAAEKAERDKQQAIAEEQRKAHEEAERIKRENEKREQARLAEEKRIKDEEARRAANIAHQKKINNAAMTILMSTGLSEAAARECVCAIVKNQKALAASGQRPPISINY